MGFWDGIKKMLEGAGEATEAALNVVPKGIEMYKQSKRDREAGIHSIHIPSNFEFRRLWAVAQYRGPNNPAEIKSLRVIGLENEFRGNVSPETQRHVDRVVKAYFDKLRTSGEI